ncbi:general secretion pathway protein GspK [Hyphomicrobium sp.]|uniref:general secretion pathway protein GspK n=1 Tax=Hyphomicrobium sp. TaxID=82 RepID=UPI003F6EEA2F
MALAQVIWGIGLLTVLATTLLTIGNNSYSLARNAAQRAGLEATYEAAVARAIVGLIERRPDHRWRVDGIEQTFRFNDTDIRIAVQDELGRFNLNHIEQPTLVRLLQSAGMPIPSANKLADKILDWREPAPAKRLNGAKAADYEIAALVQRPRNGPFQSVSELRLVMDMTDEIFDRIEPALTIYSGSQFIDPTFAPHEALIALPNMNPQETMAIISARTKSDLGTLPMSAALAGRAFSIRSEILISTDNVLKKHAVIRLTDDPNNPFWMLNSSER